MKFMLIQKGKVGRATNCGYTRLDQIDEKDSLFFKVKIHRGINEKMPKGYKVSIQSITTLLPT